MSTTSIAAALAMGAAVALVACGGDDVGPGTGGRGGGGGQEGTGGSGGARPPGCGDAMSCALKCRDRFCAQRCAEGTEGSAREAFQDVLQCLADAAAAGCTSEECLREPCGEPFVECLVDRTSPLTCANLYDCLVMCTDVRCESRCLEVAADESVELLAAYVECVQRNGCLDAEDPLACEEEFCADEADACISGG